MRRINRFQILGVLDADFTDYAEFRGIVRLSLLKAYVVRLLRESQYSAVFQDA